jgi:hypothetical protein
MTNLSVKLSSGEEVTTCPAAVGFSFAAGTTDGPGAFDFTQGDDQVKCVSLSPTKIVQDSRVPLYFTLIEHFLWCMPGTQDTSRINHILGRIL